MKYRNCTHEDFLHDEFFKQWVKKPDAYSNSYWESFIQQYPEKVVEVEKARYFIQSLQYPDSSYKAPGNEEIERSYEQLIKKSDELWLQQNRDKDRRLGSYLRVAASLVFILLFGFVVYFIRKDISAIELATPQVEMINRVVPIGHRLTEKLPDGTLVKLNSNSRLIYPSVFTEENREVQLEGEAYFEVVKDTCQPFVVKSKDFSTVVLGTSFNIKAYADEGIVQIAVLTGKVKVEKSNIDELENIFTEVYLEPMELLNYDYANDELVKKTFEYHKIMSWKDNVLYFKDADFEEIVASISKWYGKEFEIKKYISGTKDFSAQYENQSLDMVLEGICFAFGCKYEIQGNTVIIY